MEAPGHGRVILASRREPGCPTCLLPGPGEREKSDHYNHGFAAAFVCGDNKMEIVFTGRVCFRLQQEVLPSHGQAWRVTGSPVGVSSAQFTQRVFVWAAGAGDPWNRRHLPPHPNPRLQGEPRGSFVRHAGAHTVPSPPCQDLVGRSGPSLGAGPPQLRGPCRVAGLHEADVSSCETHQGTPRDRGLSGDWSPGGPAWGQFPPGPSYLLISHAGAWQSHPTRELQGRDAAFPRGFIEV